VKGQISLGLRSETSSVKRIGIIDDRRIIKHSVPGGYGTVFEDRGKESARLLIEGQFVGEEAMNGISSLRKKYKKGEPLNLTSDVSLLSNINKVLIEDIRIQMSSSVQMSYDYELILREYVEPPKKPSVLPPSQKAEALKDVSSTATDVLQDLKQGAESASQELKGLGETGSEVAGELQKLEQKASEASQKAQALAEVGSKAVQAIEGLDDGGTSPSQKAQAIAEVGSQASKILKGLAKD
jgi:methyl-accepting chemotaxis protein